MAKWEFQIERDRNAAATLPPERRRALNLMGSTQQVCLHQLGQVLRRMERAKKEKE